MGRVLTSDVNPEAAKIIASTRNWYWLGERKAPEQLKEASVRIAFARQSRESITRTRTSTSTIEEVETLNPTAPVRDEKYPKQSLT